MYGCELFSTFRLQRCSSCEVCKVKAVWVMITLKAKGDYYDWTVHNLRKEWQGCTQEPVDIQEEHAGNAELFWGFKAWNSEGQLNWWLPNIRCLGNRVKRRDSWHTTGTAEQLATDKSRQVSNCCWIDKELNVQAFVLSGGETKAGPCCGSSEDTKVVGHTC